MPREDRPAIPEPIKRAVRQRCGFGCVICGIPLYDYDHMVEYSVVKEHEAENLTLLCKQHHDEKTKGLLPLEVVLKADADPFNLRAGVTSPYALHYAGDVASVALGSNEFTATGHHFAAVLIDGIPIIYFRFEDGQYLLTVQLFDEFNEPVLIIRDNELVHSVTPWDVEFIQTRMIIRGGRGDIFLELRFRPPGRLEIPRGRLLLNGVRILIQNESVLVGESLWMIGGRTESSPAGISVGYDPNNIPAGRRVHHVNRYTAHNAASRGGQ
ncbi:cell division protein [Rhodococcus hoagii]|nr:cell division protein [Prescottella equi]